MAEDRPLSVDRLPTLTEVLELGPEFDNDLPFVSFAAGVGSTQPAQASAAIESPALDLNQPALDAPAQAGALAGQVAPMRWDEIMRAMAARATSAEPPTEVDEAAIVRRVLAELQPRVSALLEARLREALAPALARAGETLIREARDELGAVARALVEESLAQVMRQPPQG